MSRIPLPKLVRWGLVRKPLRTAFLLLAVIGSMAAFLCTEAVMRNIAERSIDTWRLTPYDLSIKGSDAYEVEERIASLKGVSAVERGTMFNVMVGAMYFPVVLPQKEHPILVLEYVEGQAPGNDSEIAIPAQIARANGLSCGDDALIADHGWLDRPLTYVVSGILHDGQSYGRTGIMTAEGAQRILGDLAPHKTLLIRLHPSAPQYVVRNTVDSAGVRVNIQEHNPSFNQGFSIAEALTALTKLLLLSVAVISLNMLIILGQRERAYEIGVLRALGLDTRRMVSILTIEGVVVVLAGGLISMAVLLFVAKLYNMGSWVSLFVTYMPSVLLLLGLSVCSVYLTSRQFVARPITTLFRER